MDRLAGIVRCQWRAYWRRFSRARDLTVGHQGITLIITVLIFFKYLRLLGSANIQIAQGDATLVQSLLAAIFLASHVIDPQREDAFAEIRNELRDGPVIGSQQRLAGRPPCSSWRRSNRWSRQGLGLVLRILSLRP